MAIPKGSSPNRQNQNNGSARNTSQHSSNTAGRKKTGLPSINSGIPRNTENGIPRNVSIDDTKQIPEERQEEINTFEPVEEGTDSFDDEGESFNTEPSSLDTNNSTSQTRFNQVTTEENNRERKIRRSREVNDNKEKPRKRKRQGFKKDKNGQNTFIDTKKGKLNPFGNRKNRVKTSVLDKRNDLRRKSKIIQFTIIVLLIVILLFAIIKTFVPNKSLNAKDVLNIVGSNTTLDTTGFPSERGGAFAKEFIQAYATMGSAADSDKVLGLYYNGKWGSAQTGNSDNRQIVGKFASRISYGPTIYNSKPLTPYSANYTIAVLVSPTVVDNNGSLVNPPADGSSLTWWYFSVNVYYDKDSDSFAVTKDSPTVVPAQNVSSPANIPADDTLAKTKVSDPSVASDARKIVVNYMTNYQKSSPSNHSSLDNLVQPGSSSDTYSGMDNAYQFDGSVDNAIVDEPYTDDETSYSTIKSKVTVTWRVYSGDQYVKFNSVYVITLSKQSNGQYLVSKMAPYYYSKANS